MDQLTPEQIAGRSFRSAFRGLDPAEVKEFLAAVARQLEELSAQRDRLAGRLGEFAERDLKSEFALVGNEVTTVLEAARTAADGMRDRAAADSARWRSEALAESEADRRSARDDAEHLRSDAWLTGEDLLRQSQVEARHLAESAERDALSVLGEAEREAHRLAATARRESEELSRMARMEAERLNAEAVARHDEIVEAARRQAEASQERARALEQRRQELLTELETLRSSLSRMEGELDERRTQLGLSAAATDLEDPPSSLRPARKPPGASEDWEPGETVRVISRERRNQPTPTSTRTAPAPDPDQVAEEARRSQASTAAAAVPADDQATPAVTDAEIPLAQVGEPDQVSAEPARVTAPDEVSAIFSRLRASPPSQGAEAPGTAAAGPGAKPSPEPLTDTDPIELMQKLVLPVSNRALRNFKKQLTEMQNDALEEIRVSAGTWRPSAESMKERIRPDLVVLAAESFAMGHSAAEELVGKSFPRPPTPPRDAARHLAQALSEQIEHVLAGGEDESGRELSAAVSRVFRGWRTDEAERRVNDLASEAYHDGLKATLAAGKYRLKWIVGGRGCARCREAAESDEARGLPLHPGCGCTLVPLAS